VATQPFKPVFLASAGQPPVPWERWVTMFEDWLLAIGFPTGEEYSARKAAILRASLGTEGYRIYSSLATNLREDYASATKRLEDHFVQKSSTVFQRAQFTRRQQRAGETISQYVAALREMAVKCEFPAGQLNERVRDQLIAWCYSDRIRERLLQEPSTKSLDEFVNLAMTMERAMAEAPALATVERRPVNRVKTSATRDQQQQPGRSKSCFNCGQTGHFAKSDMCPARDKKCGNCGKTSVSAWQSSSPQYVASQASTSFCVNEQRLGIRRPVRRHRR